MKVVLAPIDFSDATEAVLAEAERLARAFGGRLLLMHVEPPEPDFVGYGPGPTSVRNQVAEEMRSDHRRLDQVADRLRATGLAVEELCIQGPPAEKILEKAAHFGADWIVMGSHGHGALYHLLLGSVGEEVLQKAACPVMIVRAPGRPEPSAEESAPAKDSPNASDDAP